MRTDVCKVLVRKLRRKRQLGRARCKWILKIKTDVYGNLLEVLECIDLGVLKSNMRDTRNVNKNYAKRSVIGT